MGAGKWTFIVLIALVVVIGVFVFLKSGLPVDTQPPVTTDPVEPVSTGPVSVEMRVSEFGFSPSTVTVSAGEPLTISVRSLDKEHGFYIPSKERVVAVPTAEAVRLRFTFDEPGEYPFWSDRTLMKNGSQIKGVIIVI